jgi:hypothetical protein
VRRVRDPDSGGAEVAHDIEVPAQALLQITPDPETIRGAA